MELHSGQSPPHDPPLHARGARRGLRHDRRVVRRYVGNRGIVMSDLHNDAAENLPTMPHSTRSPKDAAAYRRLATLMAQTGGALPATEALIAETDWRPKPRAHRELPCRCRTDGHMCEDHAPRAVNP